MAWIESHQTLRLHPKTLEAVAILGMGKAQFIGHLHLLWWWALDVADQDGRLPERCTVNMLADAAELPRAKGAQFIDALVESGFVEQTTVGYTLHNWYNYAGKLLARRERNKEAMRETRVKHVDNTSEPRVKLPNPTLPNQPNPTNRTLPNPSPDGDAVDKIASDFAQYGKVNAGTAKAIEWSVLDYGEEWVALAVKRTAGSGAEGSVPWSYVESTLESWKKNGGPDARNTSGAGSNGADARQDTYGVANRVRGLEPRSAAVARLGRNGQA